MPSTDTARASRRSIPRATKSRAPARAADHRARPRTRASARSLRCPYARCAKAPPTAPRSQVISNGMAAPSLSCGTPFFGLTTRPIALLSGSKRARTRRHWRKIRHASIGRHMRLSLIDCLNREQAPLKTRQTKNPESTPQTGAQNYRGRTPRRQPPIPSRRHSVGEGARTTRAARRSRAAPSSLCGTTRIFFSFLLLVGSLSEAVAAPHHAAQPSRHSHSAAPRAGLGPALGAPGARSAKREHAGRISPFCARGSHPKSGPWRRHFRAQISRSI